MEIKRTTEKDISTVVDIYNDARIYMRKNGNLHQWADGYPQEVDIRNDIKNRNSYIVTENNNIIGTFAFIQGPDPTYAEIYNGKWLNNAPYYVIHRIAVSEHKKGVASYIFKECFKICANLRVDTHRDNIPMQNVLKKNGFEYCGIIYLLSGDERLAYQRIQKV